MSRVGGEVLVAEHGEQPFDDVEVVEVLWRQVDRQADGPPGDRIDDVADQPARRLDHRQVELGDHVHLFGELDEAGRRDRALGRAGPPGEGFDRRHGAGAQIDHRLEDGVDRPAANAPPQLGFELGAGDDSLLHRRFEDDDLVASLALAAVHRDVGPPEQLLGVDGLAVDHRHADRGADVEPAPPEPQWRPDRPAIASAIVAARCEVAVLEHHDELVAAEAGCRAAAVDRLLDPPGDLLEHPVTGRVPAPVVDRLEPVEVDEQHGERVAVLRRTARCPA